jgi:hypothetical protein
VFFGRRRFSRAWPIGDRSRHVPGFFHLDISSGLTHLA